MTMLTVRPGSASFAAGLTLFCVWASLAVPVERIQPAAIRTGAEIYRFELSPTARAAGATGLGQLTLGWSPFGVAVNTDGHLVYDLEITTRGLIDPNRQAAGGTYVAWIASPDLTRIVKLGGFSDGKLTTRISSWNKFLVLITLESDPEVEARTGPVVLRGRSPSGFLASFQSHELFNLIPHE